MADVPRVRPQLTRRPGACGVAGPARGTRAQSHLPRRRPLRRPCMSFEPVHHPIVFDEPRRLTDVDSWHEHIPCALFAVTALEQRRYVVLAACIRDTYCVF